MSHTLPKSKTLQKTESEKPVPLTDMEMASKTFAQFEKGRIKSGSSVTIDKVMCFGEHVAVLPIEPVTISPGGIAMPSEENKMPTIGVIVGIGKTAEEEINAGFDLMGKTVKYRATTNLKLTRIDLPNLGDAEVYLTSHKNIVCILPPQSEVTVINAEL